MRRIAAALLALAACGGPADDDRPRALAGDSAGIPFRLVGPNDAALVVPVHIHGQGPFDFVLDTGATLTCVDRNLARRLGLPDIPGRGGYGAGVGGAMRVGVVRIDSLRIGDARAADLLACSLDLSRLRALGTDVDGLLGLNVLRAFRVTLDFQAGRLRLERP